MTALREKRQEVVTKLKSLQAETDDIIKIFEEPEVQRQIQSSRLVVLFVTNLNLFCKSGSNLLFKQEKAGT